MPTFCWPASASVICRPAVRATQPAVLPPEEEPPACPWRVLHADWSKPSDVKAQFGTASILQDGRVVFNIAGNKYRIVVWINYAYRVVYIRFIGTHAQYDAIDAQTS